MSHQIEVPLELFAEWLAEGRRQYPEPSLIAGFVAEKAAGWAADQELEACCEWLEKGPYDFSVAASDLTGSLHGARRPKPPSLKQQALDELEEATQYAANRGTKIYTKTIRRALESIPDEQ